MVLALGALTRLAAEKTYLLPAPLPRLLEDEASFASFAREVADDTDRLTPAPLADDQLRLLLGLQVHLGLLLGRDDEALAASSRIREALPDDAAKAYAGLVLQAFVTARQESGARVGSAEFRAAFARDFSVRLDGLPYTNAMRANLELQRRKVAAMTAESLRGEFAATTAALDGRGYCTLAEADRLARLRHRYADLLPLRAELLEALAQAIAARAGV